MPIGGRSERCCPPQPKRYIYSADPSSSCQHLASRRYTEVMCTVLPALPAIVFVGALIASTTSCMRTVNMSDPALEPFASMYAVDRSQFGFTPVPKTGH